MKGMIRMEENEDNIVYLNPYTREELLKMMQLPRWEISELAWG